MRRVRLLWSLTLASCWLVGCDEGGVREDRVSADQSVDESPASPGGEGDSNGAPEADAEAAASHGVIYAFGTNVADNEWTVTVFDATREDPVVADFTVDELAALSAAEDSGGNGAGPAWGDAVVSTDGSRVFVNARTVAKVAVFDTATHTLETLLDVGARPVHAWNPNHGDQIWTHADGAGAFYVIDQQTLEVSDPLVAALHNTGHGKLLYAPELGTKYYATNTNDPGVFAIDGDAMQVSELIGLCSAPCADDPATEEDESKEMCGSTHDKAYNPVMGYAIFQCTGGNGYALVDAESDEVVHDLVEISGSVAHTDDNAYILVIGHGERDVQIWDTRADGHDGVTFDSTITVGGEASARGTHFRKVDGAWEAWIPQTAGDHVAVLNLSSHAIELVEVGTLTKPEGARHFSRRGALGITRFYTYSDAGVVAVDLESKEVALLGAPGGAVSRVAFVPVRSTEGHTGHGHDHQ